MQWQKTADANAKDWVERRGPMTASTGRVIACVALSRTDQIIDPFERLSMRVTSGHSLRILGLALFHEQYGRTMCVCSVSAHAAQNVLTHKTALTSQPRERFAQI